MRYFLLALLFAGCVGGPLQSDECGSRGEQCCETTVSGGFCDDGARCVRICPDCDNLPRFAEDWICE
jgi:hypothetical protein